jgi:hypothetical protein
MRHRLTKRQVCGFLMAMSMGLLFGFPANSCAESVAVIVSKDSALLHLSKPDVRGIYLGEIRFIGGMPVKPLQYPEGNVKDIFLNGLVGMTSKDYKLYWVKKLFQEGLMPPTVRNDPYEIMDIVRQDHWGIGYVPKEMVDKLNEVIILYTIQGGRP